MSVYCYTCGQYDFDQYRIICECGGCTNADMLKYCRYMQNDCYVWKKWYQEQLIENLKTEFEEFWREEYKFAKLMCKWANEDVRDEERWSR